MAQPSRGPLTTLSIASNHASVRVFSMWRHATRATPSE